MWSGLESGDAEKSICGRATEAAESWTTVTLAAPPPPLQLYGLRVTADLLRTWGRNGRRTLAHFRVPAVVPAWFQNGPRRFEPLFHN